MDPEVVSCEQLGGNGKETVAHPAVSALGDEPSAGARAPRGSLTRSDRRVVFWALWLALTTTAYSSGLRLIAGSPGNAAAGKLTTMRDGPIPSMKDRLALSSRPTPGPPIQVAQGPTARRIRRRPAPPRETTDSETSAPATSAVPEPPRPPEPPAATEASTEPKRVRVRDRRGRTVVARVHGGTGSDTHVLMPDGQLGIIDALTYTSEPFQPDSIESLAAQLQEGPFADFQLKTTQHYVILYQSTDEFADASARVLENLYKGLLEAFRKRDVPVHDAEFPLVAVIFRTEADFRAFRKVDAEVQAYYEIYSNRIHFYQSSHRDEGAPEVAALRRPQTVAHEGTHQILQNIGIQPRLAAWPSWLIEGLAEYCSTPSINKKGATNWTGLGMVNALHMATIHDLDEPVPPQLAGNIQARVIHREPGQPLVEYLLRKSDLTPTDYALAWALTHFLAMKRVDPFIEYLKTMSQMPPLVKRTADEQVADFRAAFGQDLNKLDREIGVYLSKLKVNYVLPYYAVMFEQRVPGGLIKRAAMVSQSPNMIVQWLDTVSTPRGDAPLWKAVPFRSRSPALIEAERFVRGQ